MPLSRWKGMAERMKETRVAVMFSRRMYLQIRTVYCKDIVSLKRRKLAFHMSCQFSCDLQPVFAYPDIRITDIRIYPLILRQPKIRIS